QRSGFAQFHLHFANLNIPIERDAEMRAAASARAEENSLPVGLRTIPILLVANEHGRIARAQVGEIQLEGFDALQAELTSILQDPELPFDRANVSVDRNLMSAELKRVMEVIFRSKFVSIQFDVAN